MITIVFCLRRLPSLTPEEFSAYWRERHAELFREYASALNVRRYTQSHRLDVSLNKALRAGRSAPEAYDGVAQVWFDSMEDLLAGVLSPEGRLAGEALIEDEKAFIDHANSPIFAADEVEIIG